HFQFPLRNVVPKPVQKPHPPLWMACSQLGTIERAGQLGFGALGFQFVSADAAHAWVHAYYNAITKRLDKLADYPTNPNIELVSFLNQAGKNEHEHICEGLELFAKEVMPEFHANEPAQQAWKEKVLAREIELEEIDTQPFRDRFGGKFAGVLPTAKAATG